MRIKNITETLLTDTQKSILDGLIISDGHLANKGANCRLSLTNINLELIKDAENKLPFRFKTYTTKASKRLFPQEKFCECKQSYILTSTVDKTLTIYYNKWYKDKKKIIPKDLQINPVMLLYWFYGDGHSGFKSAKIANNRKTIYVKLGLCTNGFAEEDIDFLINLLNEQGLRMYKRYTKTGTELQCNSYTDIYNFYNYLELANNYYLDCFSYKFKYPQCKINQCNIV